MRKLRFIIALVVVTISVSAVDVFDDIGHAIQIGDAKQLATYFENSIDLTILDNENVYSKAQAELVIKDFFSKNPPKTFTTLHKGSSPEGTQYAIGTLVTTNGKSLRISYYFKNNNGKPSIREFRIENE